MMRYIINLYLNIVFYCFFVGFDLYVSVYVSYQKLV